MDIPSIANEGYGGGTVVNGIEYDIYGAHLQVASKTSCYVLNYTHIYKKSGSTDAYYRDVEITGDALKQLKACIGSSNGVWLHNGFVMADMSSESGHGECQVPYSTFMIYCSRIELRFVISSSSFNR